MMLSEYINFKYLSFDYASMRHMHPYIPIHKVITIVLYQTLQFVQWVKGQSVPWRISEEDIVRKIKLFVLLSTNI